MSKFIGFMGIFFIGFLCQKSFAADIKYKLSDSTLHKDYCGFNLIILSGDIVVGDSKKLLDTLSQISSRYKKDECTNGFLSLQLDSNGGDILEAMKIGRTVRANNLRTIVPFNSVCNSSCVLVLAAGVRRDPIGQVGIHRPYFSSVSPNLSTSEIQSKRNELTKKIREFIDEMDVSQILLDKMLSVPPEKVRILSQSELEELRLSVDDANFDEKKVAEQASLYNLTSSEYRKRNVIADQSCKQYFHKNISEYTICTESILLRIPKSEAKKRLFKASSFCSNLGIENGIKCWKEIVAMGQ